MPCEDVEFVNPYDNEYAGDDDNANADADADAYAPPVNEYCSKALEEGEPKNLNMCEDEE